MLRLKYTLIQIILFLILIISVLYILIGLAGDWKLLVIPLILLYVFVLIWIKRQRKILRYVRQDFLELGFELINEKPMPLSHIDISFSVGVSVSGIPISRLGYIVRYERVFRAIYENGEHYDLYTRCTKRSNFKNKVLIFDRKRI